MTVAAPSSAEDGLAVQHMHALSGERSASTYCMGAGDRMAGVRATLIVRLEARRWGLGSQMRAVSLLVLRLVLRLGAPSVTP